MGSQIPNLILTDVYLYLNILLFQIGVPILLKVVEGKELPLGG